MNSSKAVSINDGQLEYKADDKGNKIPDFSNCGYQGGGVEIPNVDVLEVLLPNELGDDGDRIQAAINRVAAMSEDNRGFKGVVLLKKGTYRIEKSIRILSNGIILRGEGQGEDGTTLVAMGRGKRSLIEIGGVREPVPRGLEQIDYSESKGIAEHRATIVDPYVAVGSHSFRLTSTDVFSVGDEVIVHRPSTAAWISAIGMDRIEGQPTINPKARKTRQWEPGKYDMLFRRKVVVIDGDVLTVDAPLVQAIEDIYGGGTVYRYQDFGRIERVGIENLRGISEYDKATLDKRREGEFADEEHAWNLITINHARDGWVRDVTSVHFAYSCVYLLPDAHRFTVQDCSCLDPVSRVTGGRRYSFAIAGQMNLVQRCRTRRGRHDYVLHARAPGPNAFVDCVAENAFSDTGPHHRWSVGTLFDNVRVEGNAINVQDRQDSGTGHGWAGALKVLWNCEADSIVCQKPPTTQNYAIGCVAERAAGWHERANGYWESHGEHVEPRSLYYAQLEERMGRDAVEAVGKAHQL